MAIKSQKLLPSAIKASKKTISTSVLRDLKPEKPIEIGEVSKKDSLAEKFGVISEFLKKEYKRDRMSWFRERKRKREERRKKREEELEKKKKKSKIGKGISATLPLKNIFDNISNFLLFLAGGFLLNKILNILPQLMEIGKILKPITIGIYNFGKFMFGTVIGFIDAGYAIHDDLRSKVEELGGEDAVEKFDKFAKEFKKVINGAIILAMLSTLLPKKRRGKVDCKPCQPCICREPQRVPVRVFEPVRIRIRTPSTATEGGYNFDWAKIFERLRDPIRGLLKRRQGRTVGQLPEDGDIKVPTTVTVPGQVDWGKVTADQWVQIIMANLSNPQVQTELGILGITGAAAFLEPTPFGEGAALANTLYRLTKLFTRLVKLGTVITIPVTLSLPTLPLPAPAKESDEISTFNPTDLHGAENNIFPAGNRDISTLASFPSYNNRENLMVFNKTFIQDRYIVG